MRPKGGRPSRNGETVARFSADTAAQVKKSQRAIQQRLQVAAGLTQEVRATLRGTPAANRTRCLMDLARIKDSALQLEIAQLLATGEVRSVAAALGKIEPPTPDHDDPVAADTLHESDPASVDRTEILRRAVVFDWKTTKVSADWRWIYPFLAWWLNPDLTKLELMEHVKAWNEYFPITVFQPIDVFLNALPEPLRQIAPGYVPEDFREWFREEYAKYFPHLSVDDDAAEHLWKRTQDDPSILDDLFVITDDVCRRGGMYWPMSIMVEQLTEAREKGREAIRQQAQQIRDRKAE